LHDGIISFQVSLASWDFKTFNPKEHFACLFINMYNQSLWETLSTFSVMLMVVRSVVVDIGICGGIYSNNVLFACLGRVQASEQMIPYNPRDEVHAKHESHMACLLASMPSVSIMALYSFLGRQWVSPFFLTTFYFGEMFFRLKNLGILKIRLACSSKEFE
jgi:hypothetical protein